MGCAFSQESEARRKQAQLQRQHPQPGNKHQSRKLRGQNQHEQQRSHYKTSQQHQNKAKPSGSSNVYSPVIKTATVNSRGSRTTASPIKTPSAVVAENNPQNQNASAPAEPEDIHFRRQHFDRNSVLRHSKKRSRKASSPYANKSPQSQCSEPRATGKEKEADPNEEKQPSPETTKLSSEVRSPSTTATTKTAKTAPKRNAMIATTIAISTDGSSRVIANGNGTPSEEEKEELSLANESSFGSKRSPEKQDAFSNLNSTPAYVKVTTASAGRKSQKAGETESSPRTKASDVRIEIASSPTRETTTTRSARRSRHEVVEQEVVVAIEEKSDECGRLI